MFAEVLLATFYPNANSTWSPLSVFIWQHHLTSLTTPPICCCRNKSHSTLHFIVLLFLFHGLCFPFAVERKSTFDTFSYNTTCILRGAMPLSHLPLTPRCATISANRVGLVDQEIALQSRAQFCFQTSASDNSACWSSASADIRGNCGDNHQWNQSNQSFFYSRRWFHSTEEQQICVS